MGATDRGVAFCKVRGEIGEFAFLKLSKDFLKRAECSVGDWVNVRFNIDDQDVVDLPEALVAALAADRKFSAAWKKLTAGKKRGIAY